MEIKINGSREEILDTANTLAKLHPNLTIDLTESPEERAYTYEEVFSRGCIWEEIVKDGKKLLRRVKPASEKMTQEEYFSFLAGRFDAFFQLHRQDRMTIREIAECTDKNVPQIVDLYRLWGRYAAAKPKRKSKLLEDLVRYGPHISIEIVDDEMSEGESV